MLAAEVLRGALGACIVGDVNAATPELRILCPEDRKRQVLRHVAERLAAAGAQVDTTDGLRVTEPDGWWLLRASGTEPKLTIRCEAADETRLGRLCAAVGAHLEACGIAIGIAIKAR